MAAKKVGVLIKEARTNAGLTQAQLADRVSGLTAADISKAERGDKVLTDAQLKTIAKVTGVTQKSLLEAPKGGTASTGSTSASSGKTSMQLTSTEKKLVELYRAADSDTKKKAMNILKGESSSAADMLSSLLGSASSSSSSSSGKTDDILGMLLGGMDGSGSSNILSSLLGGGGSGKADILSALLSAKREVPEGGEAGEVREIREIPEDDPLKEVK